MLICDLENIQLTSILLIGSFQCFFSYSFDSIHFNAEKSSVRSSVSDTTTSGKTNTDTRVKSASMILLLQQADMDAFLDRYCIHNVLDLLLVVFVGVYCIYFSISVAYFVYCN